MDEELEYLDDDIDVVNMQNSSDDNRQDDDDRNNRSKKNKNEKSKSEQAYDKKFNEDGQYDKNYYKKEGEELKAERQEYKANNGYKEQKAEAKQNLKDAKEKYRSAKKGGGQPSGAQPSAAPTAAPLAKEGADKAKEGTDTAKDGVKEAKKGVKDAKDALNDVKDKAKSGKLNPLRQAANKLDNARSKAYSVRHPVKAAKKKIRNKIFSPVDRLKKKAKDAAKKGAKNAAKKTGKAAVKGAKVGAKAAVQGAKVAGSAIAKLAALAVEFWPVTLVIAVIGLLVGFSVLVAALFGEDVNLGVTGDMIASTTCAYENLGGINKETQVQLISCDGSRDLEKIPLEKYVAGVAIAEMGEEAITSAPEAMKAQLIAVRSYTLTRSNPTGNVGYDAANNVIRMRWCENDQVYWDYTKDIYRSGGNVATYSYLASDGYSLWKHALSEEKIKEYESLARTVSGFYLVNDSGSVINTNYIDTTTQGFINQAMNNAGTDNGKYTAILLQTYASKKAMKVESAECETAAYYTGEAGEYSQWKQKSKYGASWGSVQIGTHPDDTIDKIGCLLTSIAMQIANSGVDTSNVGTYAPNYATEGFNPGTFATALKKAGNILGSGGGLDNWSGISTVVPGISCSLGEYSASGNISHSTIKSKTEEGCYLVLKVLDNQHWVALDANRSAASGWSEIYIWDPASNEAKNEKVSTGYLGGKYKLYRYGCCKVK